MPIEFRMLAFSIILGFVQILIAAGASTTQRGVKWNVSAREGEPKPLRGIAGRLDRAMNNFKETFPLFVASLFLAYSSDSFGELTAIGSQVYFWGRVIYIPMYAFAIPYLRSLVWATSTAGIAAIVLSIF